MNDILLQARDARNAGKIVLARDLALIVMDETEDVATRMRATEIYAWTLFKMERYGEALEYMCALRKHYTREDGMLSFTEAYVITGQVAILQEMGIGQAGAALLEELRERVKRETDRELASTIEQRLKALSHAY
jgi:hypothetical protein